MPSFRERVAEKEAATQKAKQEEPKPIAEAVEVVEQAQNQAVEESAVDEQVVEEIEAESQVSKDAIKMIAERGSFKDLINQKLQEKSTEEVEEEEEVEAATETRAEPIEIEVEGKKLAGVDAIKEYLGTVAEERKALAEEKQQIQDFVEKVSDPDLIEVMRFVAEGYAFPIALVKAGLDESVFDLENLEETDKETLVRAKIERENQIKEQQKAQKRLQKNMEESNKALAEFQTSEGFDDKVKQDLVGLMSKIHAELLDGLVTKETLTLFARGLNYKKAIEEARETGEIAGRNAKIAVEKAKAERGIVPQLGKAIPQEKPKQRSKLSELVTVPPTSFMEKLRNR